MEALLKELANKLHQCFATDQTSFALQSEDGSYRRKTGVVTPQLLTDILKDEGSIAVYQKGRDQTVNWICYDFDIYKKHLETDSFKDAEEELYRAVAFFSTKLNYYEIPHLLEFSGNRGFHVWITFNKAIDYNIAHSILETILTKSELQYNTDLIAIDKFPSTHRASGGVGKAVKLPVSKHKKSGVYSLLFENMPENPCSKFTSLTSELVQGQIDILSAQKGTTKSEVERCVNEFFLNSTVEYRDRHRVKSIWVYKDSLSIDSLVHHWQTHPPLAKLARSINGENHLGHQERKLLVGILNNVRCNGNDRVGQRLIHDIAKRHENYNPDITEKAISSLSSFDFPSQEQIEGTMLLKFEEDFSIEALLSACIPCIENYEEATFEIGLVDIDVSRASELNYLYLNDEVHIRTVIEELINRSPEELCTLTMRIIKQEEPPLFYEHFRKEENKDRRLVTPSAATRVATSCILKQLLYFLDFQTSPNSHGYIANRGFQEGYIFKPWLFLWIKFISNISSAIQNESNRKYFIVKTDIHAFYDDLPHDNLKRLLLGGVNPKIDKRINSLDQQSHETYKAYIDVLFKITASMVGDKKGLPQGPAYARYIAELYLANIDDQFDHKLSNGELYLYQRYVDDIFFIAPSEKSAREILDELKNSLELIGLSINLDKTKVSEICSFSDDFDSYRAQSKYAVDRASRDFENATETQKNLAINEFMALIQSESCTDDLAFIFSHLEGVNNLDSVKRQLVLPTIHSGIGRGSLYKHLFSFTLKEELSDNLIALEEVSAFTELQSEVLTAVFITEIEENKQRADYLLGLLDRILSKLKFTPVVEEHIAFLCMKYEFDFSSPLVSPEAFLKCLQAMENGESLIIKSSIVNHINTSLNNLKDLDLFCRVMYSICSSASLSSYDLNGLSQTFYAKLSSDYKAGSLKNPQESMIRDAKSAWRFYYLLCVFSLSEVNSSTNLLKSMWKFCAGLFNLYGLPKNISGQPNWFAKIGAISLHTEKTQLLITSIIDGNVFRGLQDECNVFKMFHDNLLIYLAFEKNGKNTGNIQDALKELEPCGTFYKWLATPDSVSLFPNPTNRQWFERNVMDNSTIVLRKGSQVLFRKPTGEFHPESNPINHHNGYSEVLEPYSSSALRSFRETICSLDIKAIINRVLDLTNGSQENDGFPNIFVNDRLLKLNSWHPFSKEILTSRLLIYEDNQGDTQVFPSTDRHFVACCLRAARLGNNSDHLRRVDEKYLANIPNTINIIEFLNNILEQLGETLNELYIDLAAAAALYQMLDFLDPLKRIDKFVSIYHKFNQVIEDRHIYGVSRNQRPNDNKPLIFIESIIFSLSALRVNTVKSLAFFLDRDVKDFKDCLLRLGRKIPNIESSNYFDSFVRANVKLYHTSGEIAINEQKWAFSKVRLLNYDTQEPIEFEPRYSTLINSSEHVYWREVNGLLHILAMPHSFSKIYHSIEEKYSGLKKNNSESSYPKTIENTDHIKNLSNFQPAIQVISTHRNISLPKSEMILIDWLQCLPEVFHSPLIDLIAAHETMTIEELDSFINVVRDISKDSKNNPFILKRPGDFGGTHRVLQRDEELGRTLKDMTPMSFQENAEKITLICDNVISGSQTTMALKYYCGLAKIEAQNRDEGYHHITPEEQQVFLNRIKNIQQLNICCVLYTDKGKEKLSQFLQETANSSATVNIISGRDVSQNAFFGSSQRIGATAKKNIKKMLCENRSVALLGKLICLPPGSTTPRLIPVKPIEASNLVVRYCSMPKKGFLFLTQGLKHDPNCHPFIRIREAHEMRPKLNI